jgi:hypothetical protein
MGAAAGFGEPTLQHANIDPGLACQQGRGCFSGRRDGQRWTRQTLHLSTEAYGVGTLAPGFDG